MGAAPSKAVRIALGCALGAGRVLGAAGGGSGGARCGAGQRPGFGTKGRGGGAQAAPRREPCNRGRPPGGAGPAGRSTSDAERPLAPPFAGVPTGVLETDSRQVLAGWDLGRRRAQCCADHVCGGCAPCGGPAAYLVNNDGDELHVLRAEPFHHGDRSTAPNSRRASGAAARRCFSERKEGLEIGVEVAGGASEHGRSHSGVRTRPTARPLLAAGLTWCGCSHGRTARCSRVRCQPRTSTNPPNHSTLDARGSGVRVRSGCETKHARDGPTDMKPQPARN